MKLIVHPDGTREFGDISVEEYRALFDTNGAQPATKPKKRGRPSNTVEVSQLNESQLQTWQWLTAHDSPDGMTPRQYAEDANLKVDTAVYRLSKLVTIGLAHRPSTGYYRAGGGGE